jgi:hypothetical protein
MNLDRDELLIKSAFSQVKVDSKKLEKKVVEDMKSAREAIKPTPRKRASVFLIAVVFTILVGGLTAFAAEYGVFEWFRTEVDPPFIDFVDPVEINTADQGIPIEIIAAQQFGDGGIIYFSVQDMDIMADYQRQMEDALHFMEVVFPIDSHGFRKLVKCKIIENPYARDVYTILKLIVHRPIFGMRCYEWYHW